MSESAVRVPPESAYGRHVTSSRLETPTHTTGAHRAHRREARPTAQRSSARHEPYLDGLFTYCLSVLCDHEAATEALGSVLAIAERQDGRCPAAEEERKSWLYALARWTCLRALTEQRRGRQAHRRGPAPGAPHPARASARPVRTPPRRRPAVPRSPRPPRRTGVNSRSWPGPRPQAPLPSSARRWSSPCATGSPPRRRRRPRPRPRRRPGAPGGGRVRGGAHPRRPRRRGDGRLPRRRAAHRCPSGAALGGPAP